MPPGQGPSPQTRHSVVDRGWESGLNGRGAGAATDTKHREQQFSHLRSKRGRAFPWVTMPPKKNEGSWRCGGANRFCQAHCDAQQRRYAAAQASASVRSSTMVPVWSGNSLSLGPSCLCFWQEPARPSAPRTSCFQFAWRATRASSAGWDIDSNGNQRARGDQQR